MNILYTLNDKFVPQVAAGICSVCENNKEIDNITFYLISKEISEENKQKLIDFGKSYNRDVIIKELGDIKQYFDFEFDTTGWNSIVLARLILDKFLPDTVDKVLYLDGDTIVRESLKELYDANIEDYVLAASIEPTVDYERKKDLGLEKYPYYNAGVLLINLKKWREEKVGKAILDFYKENDGKLFANDQDAINGTLAGKILTVSPTYNFYNIFYQYNYKFLKKLMKNVDYIDEKTYKEAVENPTIIHYLGEERPWRKGNKHKYKEDYLKYLQMTPWKSVEEELGWGVYFVFWYIFNFITKPFPMLRYKIINSLIPTFMKFRAKKVKK